MGADKSRTQYQGLLIMDPRLTTKDALWAAQSSYTQAGPRPGVPVASGSSQMVLQASGEQASGSAMEILAQRSGMPGPGGGGVVWRNSGETLYRGWDVPSVVTGWEAVEWTDGTGPGDVREVGSPHAVTLSDGTVLVTAQVRVVVGLDTTYHVYVWARDANTGAWSTEDVCSQDDAPVFGFHPAFLVLPSGRVQLYYQLDAAGGDEVKVAMQYSDDSGDEFTLGSDSVLTTPIDTSGSPGSGSGGGDPGRMRLAYKDGQVLMVLEYQQHDTDPSWCDVFLQYASSDLGCTFSAVGDKWDGETAAGGEESGKYHDLLVLGGRFVMIWVNGARDNHICTRSVSNAFERLGSLDVVDVGLEGNFGVSTGGTGETFTDGDLAAWVDEDGVAYVIGRAQDTANEVVIGRSLDAGETWEMLGESDLSAGFSAPVGKVFDFDDSTVYPKNFCAARQGGRALFLHNWAANPGNEDNSLGCAYLGGWSTVTMGSVSSSRSDDAQVCWLATWIPIELPSDLPGWTATGAGTESLTNGYLSLSTAVTSKSYAANPPGTIAEGMVIRLSCKVTSGGSLTADTIGCRLRLADGTDDYDISVRIRLNGSQHEIRVRDNNAAADVGSDMVVASTDGVDVMIALGAASVSTWYRQRTLGTDREFTAGATSTTLTSDTATPAANNLLQWGHVTSGTAESRWFELHYVSDEYTGFDISDLSEGQDNPDELFARGISSEYISVDAGLRIRSVDGPMLAGESWDIDARYDYGIGRIFPSLSASPRIRWRSTDTTEQLIALAFDETLLGTVESALGNTTIGLYLSGINWRNGELQGYDVDTAAWVTIATIDTSTGMTGLDWTRLGNTVIPAVAGAGDQPYLHMNECANWTFGYNGVNFCRINASTEGKWDRTSGIMKRPTLFLKDASAGHPTSGGSGYLMPTEYAVIVHTAATYAGYRLKISSQSTVDGYFEIGAMVLGPVVVFGNEYAWGRRIETRHGTSVTRARDGTDRSHVDQPAERLVEFSWVDGIEMSGVEAADPDYVLPTSTGGVGPSASVGDVPYVLDGLVRLLNGPHHPIVYLPKIAKGTPDTIHLNRRHQFLYGRTAGSVSVENVLGLELSTELSRVGSITIEERT